MSVIAACVRGRHVWMATESKVNFGNDDCDTPRKHKFIDVWKGALVAAAGAERCSQVFRQAMKDQRIAAPRSIDEMVTIANRLPGIFASVGIEPVPNEGVPYYDFEALIAVGKNLWALTEDCSVDECEQFAAIGSGHAIATAAWKAIDKRQSPDRILRRIIEISCEGNVFCGGSVHVQNTVFAKPKKRR